jgi:hypothetical protein
MPCLKWLGLKKLILADENIWFAWGLKDCLQLIAASQYLCYPFVYQSIYLGLCLFLRSAFAYFLLPDLWALYACVLFFALPDLAILEYRAALLYILYNIDWRTGARLKELARLFFELGDSFFYL